MQKELSPLQIDLFTGQLVDARTKTQKQIDQERQKPQQIEMFAQREVAQFGVRANPHLPLSEHTKLVLIPEDPRTEEEIERDRLREAERLTGQLFSDCSPVHELKVTEATTNISFTLPVESRPAPIVGFRTLHRRKSISVRTRVGY